MIGGQENFRNSRIKFADFPKGSVVVGDFFLRKQTFAPPNRFYVIAVGGGDCNIRARDDFERNAYQHARRRKILVRATARDIRAGQCGTRIFIYELRLSRVAAVRTKTLHFQFDNAVSSYVIRTCGTRRATLDSNRANKFAAVGIFKAHHDNLHGGDFGRPHGAIEYNSRPDTARGLYRPAVFASPQATRLRHVACLYGDIFRNGDSVRNALANFFVHNCFRNRGFSCAMALHERLSENANHGFP